MVPECGHAVVCAGSTALAESAIFGLPPLDLEGYRMLAGAVRRDESVVFCGFPAACCSRIKIKCQKGARQSGNQGPRAEAAECPSPGHSHTHRNLVFSVICLPLVFLATILAQKKFRRQFRRVSGGPGALPMEFLRLIPIFQFW